MVKLFLSFILFLLYLPNFYAQAISAEAFTDSANYLVGDFINLTIQVEHDENVSISSPVIPDSAAKIEIIKKSEPEVESRNENLVTTFKYVISKYDSGDVLIPPVPVMYKITGTQELQTAYTNQVGFTVHTLKLKPGGDIADVKEPVTIPLDWKIIALWIFIILLLAGLGIYLYLRHKKKKMLQKPKVKKAIQRPPHVIALYELRALEQQQLWQRGKIKEYHSKITEIIRRYFQDQFYLPALELSTSEVMQYLKQVRKAETITDVTFDFLSNADLVKFAKFQPMASVNEEMMKQAVEIVEKTKPAAEREITNEVVNVQ